MATAQIVRHDSAIGSWELAWGEPHPSLRPHVRRYCGWIEDTAISICRREVPTDIVPVIILFGAPVRIFDPRDRSRWTDYGSFAAGPSDSFALVSTTGRSAGLQIDFTIYGARLFLNQPMRELANTQAEFSDIVGARGRTLTERLEAAPSWDARFAIVDREIAAQIGKARRPPAEVEWAWRRLVATEGQVRIASLVEETGRSQKHLIERFREEIGLTPKVLARVLRFGRAVHMMQHGDARLADIAAHCGYFDQAHFSRDFHAFAGVTPTELLQSRLPDSGGFSAEPT